MSLIDRLRSGDSPIISSLRGQQVFRSTITPPEPNLGIPTDQFHSQVQEMHQDGSPITDVHKAIDLHTGISDKPAAKLIAESAYKDLTNKLGVKETKLEKPLRSSPESLLQKVGVQESNIGKALKKEALTKYPFSNEAKKYINSNSIVRDESPKTDYATSLSSQDGNLTLGESPIPWGGTMGPETRGRLLGLSASQMEGNFSKERGNLLGNAFDRFMTMPTGRNGVDIKNLDTSKVAHELTHVFQEKHPINSSDFNQKWEMEKSKYPNDPSKNVFLFIDKSQIGESNLYDTSNKETLARERHAYLVEQIGTGGIKAINDTAPSLVPFYKALFQ